MSRNVALLTALIASVIFIASGCGESTPSAQKPAQITEKAKPPAEGKDEEHGHKPGQHGGIIVSIGRDNYHAEAIFEKGGTLRLLMLDNDETKIIEVDSQTLNAFVKREGDTKATPFSIQPEPQPDDAKGKTSQFVGRFPQELDGEKLEVVIASIKIAEGRFRIAFKNYGESEGHAPDMPAAVSPSEERKLYLEPGGKYTTKDIEANGNITASEKFRGVMARHDLKPQAGDKICPITLTKANPKFTWIVDGKAYEFCCPPCVDEFVRMAKESPQELKSPDAYVKK